MNRLSLGFLDLLDRPRNNLCRVVVQSSDSEVRGEDPIPRHARWGDRNSHVHRISPGVVCPFASWLDHDRFVRPPDRWHRVLVLLPLFYTQALPRVLALGPVVGPPPGPRGAAGEQRSTRRSSSEMIGNTVREPMQIRRGVAEIHDQAPPEPAAATNEFAVPGGIGLGGNGLQIVSLLPPPPGRMRRPRSRRAR